MQLVRFVLVGLLLLQSSAVLASVVAAEPVAARRAVQGGPPMLPARVADRDWAPLQSRGDTLLQERLEQALSERPEWRRLVESKRLAVALVDLADPRRPRFARVNGRHMMYAASLPKIAILLAAYQQIEEGRLQRTPEVEADLEAMIRVSSNSAATRMIDRVGGLAAVNAVLADNRYRLYDPRWNGGLWVGKRYAKDGRREPDPIHGISHGATASQVARFYYQLATGRLISREASSGMLRALAAPGIDHKFVKTLRTRVPNARLYRKSGTWRHFHADSVLVWDTDWRRYILVGLVESENGEQVLRELAEVADTLLRPAKPADAQTRATVAEAP